MNSDQEIEDYMASRSRKRGFAILGAIGAVVGVLVIVVFAMGAFYVNQDTERAVEVNLGEFNRVTGPGEHWKAPFITSIHKYDVGVQELIVGKDNKQNKRACVSTSSKDNYDLCATLRVVYRMPEDRIEWVHKNMRDYRQYLQSMAVNAFKVTANKYNMKDFAPKRDEVQRETLARLKSDVKAKIGADIQDFTVPYYSLSQDFLKHRKARKDAQTALEVAKKEALREQEVQARLNEEAEQKAHRLIVDAKADAEAQLARAQAEAEATEIRGQAEANALKAKQAVLDRSPNLIEYERVLKWDGKLPQYMLGESETRFNLN